MARMPSSRAHPLNPRAVPPPGAPIAALTRSALPSTPEGEGVARAGGFHESSYELTCGLEVIESEWPESPTVPGTLTER